MKKFRYIFGERQNTIRLAAGAMALLAVLFASNAFGDVVDDSLPPDTPQAVKTSARQAIESGLEQDSVLNLTRTMLQHRFDGQQIRNAHTLMMEAQSSGMAVEPLVNKAFEGMAKGVAPALILGAMQRVHSRNAFAHQKAAQLSGDKSSTSKLGRVLAAALAAGFAQQDADRITQIIRQQAQTLQSQEAYNLALECFYTARDVSRLGVSSQAVANMLAGALGKKFSHQDISDMRNNFMTQARHTQPQNLAGRYTDAIREGKGFQDTPGAGGGSRSGGPGSGSGGSGGSGPGGGKK